MDLSAAIRELRAEKERLEHAISLLEQLQGKGGDPGQFQGRVARGVKATKPTPRREKQSKEDKPLDPPT